MPTLAQSTSNLSTIERPNVMAVSEVTPAEMCWPCQASTADSGIARAEPFQRAGYPRQPLRQGRDPAQVRSQAVQERADFCDRRRKQQRFSAREVAIDGLPGDTHVLCHIGNAEVLAGRSILCRAASRIRAIASSSSAGVEPDHPCVRISEQDPIRPVQDRYRDRSRPSDHPIWHQCMVRWRRQRRRIS